jgi:uncharacterized protein YbjT (DUF2867 family)
MRVGVLGATGTAGSAAAAELRSRGHEVVALGRRGADRHVDVVSGDGLGEAFSGLDAVVECLNAKGTKPDVVRPVLIDGVRAALAAAADAGVGHAVSLSIVGCDRVPLGYYRIKVEQEDVVRAAALPTTVVRATQFHQLIDYTLGATKRLGFIPAPPLVLQPVDPADVAIALAEVVERGPGADAAIAGPEVLELRDMARVWRAARRSRRPVVPVPALGAALTAIAAGGLTDRDAARGGRTWEAYLSVDQQH